MNRVLANGMPVRQSGLAELLRNAAVKAAGADFRWKRLGLRENIKISLNF
jgi:hypothetical protein